MDIPYQKLEKIGAGSFSTVYKGYDRRLECRTNARIHRETKQLVAIKILNLDTAEGNSHFQTSTHSSRRGRRHTDRDCSSDSTQASRCTKCHSLLWKPPVRFKVMDYHGLLPRWKHSYFGKLWLWAYDLQSDGGRPVRRKVYCNHNAGGFVGVGICSQVWNYTSGYKR